MEGDAVKLSKAHRRDLERLFVTRASAKGKDRAWKGN
jgi:hypothetical protein